MMKISRSTVLCSDKLPSTLQPVYGSCVNGHSLLCSDVGAIFEVVMLSLLLRLEVESSQSTKVLLADRLVNSGTSPDPLTVVVSSVRPPISFRFDKTENHVLHRNRQPRNLKSNEMRILFQHKKSYCIP